MTWPYIAQLLEENSFTNSARNRITTNLKNEVRFCVYTFMYPKEYTHSIGERNSHSSANGIRK